MDTRTGVAPSCFFFLLVLLMGLLVNLQSLRVGNPLGVFLVVLFYSFSSAPLNVYPLCDLGAEADDLIVSLGSAFVRFPS